MSCSHRFDLIQIMEKKGKELRTYRRIFAAVAGLLATGALMAATAPNANAADGRFQASRSCTTTTGYQAELRLDYQVSGGHVTTIYSAKSLVDPGSNSRDGWYTVTYNDTKTPLNPDYPAKDARTDGYTWTYITSGAYGRGADGGGTIGAHFDMPDGTFCGVNFFPA
jgi:hypothetical protein